jgi:hypothetical protein
MRGADAPECCAAQVGTLIPADKRLTFAAKLFDVLDVDGDRLMDAQSLQVRRRRVVCNPNTLRRAHSLLRVRERRLRCACWRCRTAQRRC